MSLTLRIQTDGEAARLTATGEIDVRTGVLVRQGVDRALSAGANTVRLDLSAVSFIDSSGLGVLLGRHKAAARAGGRLVLVDPSPEVARLLDVTRLDEVLAVEVGDPAPEAAPPAEAARAPRAVRAPGRSRRSVSSPPAAR